MSNFTLKELQTQRDRLEAERDRLNLELQVCNRLLAEALNKIKKLTAVPVVSEHAVLRFLQRRRKIDIEEIKKEILTEDVASKIRQFGSGRYPLGDGLKAIVKENVIVSVVGGPNDGM